jgi:hypothetical protein
LRIANVYRGFSCLDRCKHYLLTERPIGAYWHPLSVLTGVDRVAGDPAISGLNPVCNFPVRRNRTLRSSPPSTTGVRGRGGPRWLGLNAIGLQGCGFAVCGVAQRGGKEGGRKRSLLLSEFFPRPFSCKYVCPCFLSVPFARLAGAQNASKSRCKALLRSPHSDSRQWDTPTPHRAPLGTPDPYSDPCPRPSPPRELSGYPGGS